MSKGRGRPATGSLYLTKSGYRARITVEIDGERVQRSYDLGTTNRAAAQAKKKRLVANPPDIATAPEEAARPETFAEAAERIVGASKIASKAHRFGRLKNHVLPLIGKKPVTEVTTTDIRDCLERIAEKGLSQDLVVHVKHDIDAVLGDLWRDEVLAENPVARVRVPKAVVDPRERAVLNDEELEIYLSWVHPEEKQREAAFERQVMALVSRVFGGVRVGDIVAMEWSAFDLGTFARGWAPRKKSARPQLLEVPEMLRPVLAAWWESQGRPTGGPMFSVRSGKRVGQARSRASNAAQHLRRDLRRAFGIEELREITMVRKNGRATRNFQWTQVRELTAREKELLELSQFTKPVDFHSFRRAFKQGLADAGVDVQAAMTLSGASDAKTHQRYLRNTAKMRQVPEAALPNLSITGAEKEKPGSENQAFSRAGEGIRTLDVNLGKDAEQSREGAKGREIVAYRDTETHQKTRADVCHAESSRLNSDRQFTLPQWALLSAAVRMGVAA